MGTAWFECAVAGRLAQELARITRLVTPDGSPIDAIAATLGDRLGNLLVVTDYIGFAHSDTDHEYILDVAYFDEATGLALLGVLVGDHCGEAAFYKPLELTEEEKVSIDEATLGYIVARIPQTYTSEQVAAAALAALGNDSLAYDVHKLPSKLLHRLLNAGEQLLDTL